MSEQYEPDSRIPTTFRSADALAILHGYSDISAMAFDLPQTAQVLDVGGGTSPLVRELGVRRPDVELVAVDLSYKENEVREALEEASPSNVSYIPGDATKLEALFGTEQFHRVFSYWLLPHLSLYDYEPAALTARGIWSVQKTGHNLSIGPGANTGAIGWKGLQNVRRFLNAPAIQVTKEAGMGTDEVDKTIQHIVDVVQVPPRLKPAFIAYQEAVGEVLGTNLRRSEMPDGKHQIYDPAIGDYVLLHGSRGQQLQRTIAWTALKNYPSARRKAAR